MVTIFEDAQVLSVHSEIGRKTGARAGIGNGLGGEP